MGKWDTREMGNVGKWDAGKWDAGEMGDRGRWENGMEGKWDERKMGCRCRWETGKMGSTRRRDAGGVGKQEKKGYRENGIQVELGSRERWEAWKTEIRESGMKEEMGSTGKWEAAGGWKHGKWDAGQLGFGALPSLAPNPTHLDVFPLWKRRNNLQEWGITLWNSEN